MYKAVVLIFTIGILLPLRWIPNLLSSTRDLALPATIALVSCSELVLGNPTMSPSGPYCSGSTVSISFTGTNLPDGDSIQIFIDDNSTYNPFSGGGDKIGSIPIEYNCTTCPTILAVNVNACNSVGSDEENEFMMLRSGSGFNVSDLIINPSVGGSGANDSIGGSQGCQFAANTTAIVNNIISNSTDCTGNIFSAGPGTEIPAGAIVVVFNDSNGPSISFDFSSLCASGLPVYILQSTCNRLLGAYSNSAASSPSYTLPGCTSGNTFSYNTPPTPGSTTSNVVALGGGSFVQTSTCADPGLSGINYPNISNSLSWLHNSSVYIFPSDFL